MNILFISHWNEAKEADIGKKLQGEVNAFEELGHHVTAIRFFDGAVWAVEREQKEKLFRVSENGMAHLLAIPKAVHLLLKRWNHYDFSYARRTFCTPWHLAMLRELKKHGVFTIEELPTYPYDEENKLYTKRSYQIAAWIERICRKYYRHWLDLFTTLSDDTEIFGVPALHIDNGVDLKSIPYVQHEYRPGGEIRLLTISSMKPWHGYERLIQGLAEYKKDHPQNARRFTIEMVGDGPMRKSWEELAKRLNISDQVIFHGRQTGKALDEIVDRCQIAVGSLSLYKAGEEIQSASSLKNREYMARGIPFVYGLQDSLPLESSFSLCLEKINDPVDFSLLEAFFENLVLQEDVSLQMRAFAEKHISWILQMEKVIDVVKRELF